LLVLNTLAYFARMSETKEATIYNIAHQLNLFVRKFSTLCNKINVTYQSTEKRGLFSQNFLRKTYDINCDRGVGGL